MCNTDCSSTPRLSRCYSSAHTIAKFPSPTVISVFHPLSPQPSYQVRHLNPSNIQNHAMSAVDLTIQDRLVFGRKPLLTLTLDVPCQIDGAFWVCWQAPLMV